MKVLKTSPTPRCRAPVTISGTGLPAGKDVPLTWGTANVDWMLDPRVDSVDYLGRKTTKYTVQLATAKTDANGAFSVKLKAPTDFGGIHDIYAVVDGTQVAKGGLLIARSRVDHARSRARSGRWSRSPTAGSARASTRAARRSSTTTSTSAP